MHLARREDHRVARDQAALRAAVVEQATAADHVVDLVGAGVAVDRRRLTRLPARDADIAVRGGQQALVHVVLWRELFRALQVDEVHAPSLPVSRFPGRRHRSRTGREASRTISGRGVDTVLGLSHPNSPWIGTLT